MAAWPAEHGPRQIKPAGRATRRRRRHRRAAGITKTQHLGRLVEGFSHGVVHGRAQPGKIVHALDDQQLRVPAGHQKQQIREVRVIRQPRGQRMSGQMIDRQKRQPVHQRHGLGRHYPDDHPADQAGPPGGRDPMQIRKSNARLVHGLSHQPVHVLQMAAGSDFRHDALIGQVFLMLGQNRLAQNPRARRALVVHHGGGGLITTGFYS